MTEKVTHPNYHLLAHYVQKSDSPLMFKKVNHPKPKIQLL